MPDGLARVCSARTLGGSTTLDLHPWAGLNPGGGDVLEIEAKNSAEREFVITAGFDNGIDPAMPARLNLRTPLAFPHMPSAPVVSTTVIVASLGALERDAISGDRLLFSDSVSGAASTELIRLGGTGPHAEIRRVTWHPTHDGTNFAHEVTLGADGRFALPPIGRIAQAQLIVEHAGYHRQVIAFAPEPGDARTLQILFKP